MCSGSELMLCLYGEGLVKDTYITSRRFSGQVPLSVWVRSHGHAFRWRSLLAEGHTIKELADIFTQGQLAGRRFMPSSVWRLDWMSRRVMGSRRWRTPACRGW